MHVYNAFKCKVRSSMNFQEVYMHHMFRSSLLAMFIFGLTTCDAKDTCLDYGGSYNEATKECEK